MIAVLRWNKVVRLTLATGLSLAVTQFAAAESSLWSLESDSYTADGGADINFISDCGCNEGENCNCNPCCKPCWTCIAGVESTFLVPEIDDGNAEVDIADGVLDGEADNEELDLHNMNFAPRVWMGLHRGEFGIVTRFWYLDSCDGERDPFEANGFGFDADSELEMQTVDVEVTRDLCVRGNKYTGSFGLRYAMFDHTTDLQSVGQSDADDATYTASSFFRQYARGTGLTGAFSGTSPIRGTVVSWFYSARGSYLFGHTDTAAETAVTLGAGGAQVSAVNGATARVDDPFIIAELQLGLIAEYRLQCYPANAFVRVAGEFQHWSGDESTSFATSFAGIGLPPTSLAVAEASTSGLDTNLFGISIATGLSY